jgi:ketosteroid isomerase-like protein
MQQHQNTEVERELAILMTEWFDSIKRRDSSFFERVLAPEWTYVMIDGSVKDKSWYIQSLQIAFDGDVTCELHELTARTFGDIAIATGHYSVTGSWQGKDMSSHSRFTSVWRKLANGWQALTHNATRITQ